MVLLAATLAGCADDRRSGPGPDASRVEPDASALATDADGSASDGGEAPDMAVEGSISDGPATSGGEQGCDLASQNCANPTQSCAPFQSAQNQLLTVCVPTGAIALGDSCSVPALDPTTGTDCGPGTLCLNSVCVQPCGTGTACALADHSCNNVTIGETISLGLCLPGAEGCTRLTCPAGATCFQNSCRTYCRDMPEICTDGTECELTTIFEYFGDPNADVVRYICI